VQLHTAPKECTTEFTRPATQQSLRPQIARVCAVLRRSPWRVSLLCRLPPPLWGLPDVLRDACSLAVRRAGPVLRRRTASFCGPVVPPGRSLVIPSLPTTSVAVPQKPLGLGQNPLCDATVPWRGPIFVARDAPTSSIRRSCIERGRTRRPQRPAVGMGCAAWSPMSPLWGWVRG